MTNRMVLAAGLVLAGCGGNLAERLLSPDETVRQAALARLDSTGVSVRREVAPRVAARLSDPNANVRRRAVQALARMGPDGVGPLLDALQGEAARGRAAAAEALGLLGADAKPALGKLVEAGHDPDDGVRLWAAVAVSRVKGTLSPSERNLFRIMHGVRDPAAPSGQAKAVFPPGDPRGTLQALPGARGKERERLIAALVGRGAAVVPVLLDALEDPAEPVRDGAAEALRRLTEKGEVR